jgi:hypothetical protein
VKEAGQETETAEGEVDERVGAAEAFLDPNAYGWELVGMLVDRRWKCGSQRTAGACYCCGDVPGR